VARDGARIRAGAADFANGRPLGAGAPADLKVHVGWFGAAGPDVIDRI